MNKEVVGFITKKWICYNCHQHYVTLPIMDTLDMGDICPRCGCTSYITKPGRIIGKKSKKFKYYLEVYNSIKDTVDKEFLGAIYK